MYNRNIKLEDDYKYKYCCERQIPGETQKIYMYITLYVKATSSKSITDLVSLKLIS